MLGVSRFDGGVVGTKGQGIKHMVGEVVLTSNDVTQRSEKIKLGRVFVGDQDVLRFQRKRQHV